MTAKLLGPADEPQGSGTIVGVRFGSYREQEIWVRSGANIGNWYPLWGEFGPRAKVAEDTRTYAQQLTDSHPWRRPPGTIPLHPHWSDVLARGPVVLLSPGDDATYTAAWRAGRRDLWQAMEEYVDDEPTEDGT